MYDYGRTIKRSSEELSREEILRRRRIRALRLRDKRRKQRIALTVLAVIVVAFLWGIYMLLSFLWGLMFQSTVSETATEASNSIEGTANVITTYFDLPYAIEDYLERYEEYSELNPELSIEDVVTNTNMGIDVPFFTREAIIIEDPYAIDALVNKVYKLPDGFSPNNLMVIDNYRSQTMQEPAVLAFQSLQEACKDLGFDIMSYSGYRSYEYQEMIYNNMVNVYGEEYANNAVSRPGHSEHGLGLSVDVSINGDDYNTIHNNQYYSAFYNLLSDYGFIVRYPEGKEEITGYKYESWHIRYVGVELAKEIEATGLTLDEYIARQY